MRKILTNYIKLWIVLVAANTNMTPQTNCLVHKENKLFVLLDLKNSQPYQIETSSNEVIYFDFCDAFTLPLCNISNTYLGYVLKKQSNSCFPLTSSHPGKYQIDYSFDQNIQENTLSLLYNKDYFDPEGYQLNLKLVCADEQFQIVNYGIVQKIVTVIIRSVHGCPVYEIPALLKLIDEYEFLIAIFALLVGFLFLFYGRVMLNITAFFSISTTLTIYLTFLCFRFMQQNVAQIYLYLTLIVILIASFTIAYFVTKHFIKASLFFIGALFGFFAGTFIKAFLLVFLAKQPRLVYFANVIMNFLTISIMVLLGSLTLEHKEYVIIYSTTVSGSYLMIRGLGLLAGGFPSQYEIYDRIEARQLSSIPLSFYIYLLLIILLATLGGLYQELKLEKERNSGHSSSNRTSVVSSRMSVYLEGNLDLIHNQIQRLIDRYRMSSQVDPNPNDASQLQARQLSDYQKMKQKQIQ